MKHKGLLLTSLTVLVLLVPSAALADTSPSITSSFTPSSIPSGGTSTLSFTITNNDSGQALTGVGFTDDLPAGLTVAAPNGVNGSCGSGTFTATAGTSTISLSGGTIAASGTCTVSADVTSSTPGVLQNSTGTVSSNEDGTGNSDVESLTVVAPPSISSAFTPTSIGTGGTSSLAFTITNPNAGSVSLSGLAFTDTLPAGLVVDNPNGVSAKCGSSAVMTANPGSGTISFSAGQLAPGTSCTVSANVTSNTAGVYQNDTGPVSSNEGGSGNSDQQSLTVIDPPSATITTPANGATYKLGQTVLADYSCQEAANGPGITDCEGDVPNGSPIDTSTPGLHTFDVFAVSGDGQATDEEVTYHVLPSNAFSISHLLGFPWGRVTFGIRIPWRGKVRAVEHAVIAGQTGQKPVLFGARNLAFAAAGKHAVLVPVGAAGRNLVSRVHAANHNPSHPAHKKIAITLRVTFTPRGGTPLSKTYHLVIVP